jgi:limonene-1,2-epoxide hydrolase
MTPAETVTEFIHRIERLDLDAALELCADDIVYDNVPMPTAEGKAATRDMLGPFVGGCSEVEWVVHRQAADGDVVLNERTDRFRIGDRWVELPVTGVWEVHDGRITLWRDYFDLGDFQNQLAAAMG